VGDQSGLDLVWGRDDDVVRVLVWDHWPLRGEADEDREGQVRMSHAFPTKFVETTTIRAQISPTVAAMTITVTTARTTERMA
jgi:hypothetical protein